MSQSTFDADFAPTPSTPSDALNLTAFDGDGDMPTMFYCWACLGGLDGDLNNVPILTSAGVAWRNPGDGFTAWNPDASVQMIDSGGYQAATRWNGAERGIRGVESTEPSIGERGTTCRFPYTARELHEWADTVDADFVAGMDVACEEASELIEMGYDDYGYLNPGRYEERLMESIDNQVRQRDHFEQHDYDHKLMPVVQGNTLDDYDQFIQWMVEEDLDKYEKIGLGTVCKRSDTDEIFDVIQLVRDYFPKKRLHLFGATLRLWKETRFHGLFESSDTAAWQWGAKNKSHHKELLTEYQDKIENAVGELEGKKVSRVDEF